jgi:hypothetical protein
MNQRAPSIEKRSSRWLTTWYRLPARIVVSDDGLCDIAPLGISMPHPSLINLVLRRGVPDETRSRLFFLHEVGHLQTLPLLLLPLLLLQRKQRTRGKSLLLNILGVEAFWELASETYVVWRARHEYSAAWNASRNPAMLLFWPLMLILAALPFLAVSGRRQGGQGEAAGTSRPGIPLSEGLDLTFAIGIPFE